MTSVTTPLATAIDAEPEAIPVGRRLSICLINPRFEPSYWGFDFALPLYPGDKRSTMISGSLTAVAGLCGDHEVRLVDENVEEIDWESLRHYDIVGVTGMNVQKARTRQILLKLTRDQDLHRRGRPVCLRAGRVLRGVVRRHVRGRGGNHLAAVPRRLCRAAKRLPNATNNRNRPTCLTVPRPRFDLLKADRYASGALQYSRGCPFQCEFCDIIVIYGRRPRVKDPDQLIAELDDMRQAGLPLRVYRRR